MVVSCSSYGCTNRRQKGSSIQFHRFPLNRPEILNKWIHAMRRKNFTPNKYSYLCSEHFNPEDYQIRPGADIKLLLENAVPSVFKGFPDHLQKKRIVRRQLVRNNELAIDDFQKDLFNEESSCNYNVLTTTMVTCGICKKQMIFEEYDSNEHRSIHYNLCWLDGKEDKIDFMDTPKIINLLKRVTNKNRSGRKFKCEFCDDIKLTLAGFAKHLGICKINDSNNENQSNKSIQCNIEMPKKKHFQNKIKILQQRLKRRDTKIKSLKSLIINIKKNVPSSDKMTMMPEEQFEIQ